MKKSNHNGFMLVETLLVSTFILGVLTYIFVQFSALKRSYDDSFKYDTVPALYGAKNINVYLIRADGYTKSLGNLTDKGYTEFSCATMTDTTCDKLLNNLEVEKVYLAKDSVFKNNINTNSAIFANDDELYYFCKKINYSNEDSAYHLIVKYKNDTYATIAITL